MNKNLISILIASDDALINLKEQIDYFNDFLFFIFFCEWQWTHFCKNQLVLFNDMFLHFAVCSMHSLHTRIR